MRLNYLDIILITTFFLLCSLTVHADHAAGGEIAYEWVGSNKYVITFKFYRDCKGIPESPTVLLCLNNPCNNSTVNISLPKLSRLPDGRPNGSQIATGCPGYGNTCDSPNALLPGFEEWWYSDTVNLQGNCNNWRLGVSIAARNISQNIAAGFLYIEATLDNSNVAYNNSTFFSTKPVPYVCINQPYTFNNGAIDTDNDSLVFEVVQPLGNKPFECNIPLTPIVFYAASPPLSIPANPFQTNNTYSLNQNTGQITYTAAQLGSHTTTVRVKEYRNNVLVGSTMRDIQVQVQNCSTTPMNFKLDTSSITRAILNSNGIIEACNNVPFSFCFSVKATDTSSLLVLSDNKNVIATNAIINYTNNGTDSVSGCFQWTPSTADSGFKVLTISSKDSSCRAPGISITEVYTIPLQINTSAPAPIVSSPINLCKNQSVTPLTASGQNLLWYTSATGGTGSSVAPTPDVSSVSTTYYYVSDTSNACPSVRVPIEVIVHDFPDFNIISEKDSVCVNEAVTLSNVAGDVVGTGYTWYIDSAHVNSTADTFINIFWPSDGLKTVTLNMYNNVCSLTDSIQVFVKRSPEAYFNIKHDICINDETALQPNEEEAIYYWTIDDHNITDTTFIPSISLKWSDTGRKFIYLSVKWADGKNECTNNHKDSVDIHTYPVADIINMTDGDICFGKQFRLKTQEGYRYSYDWEPPQYFKENDVPEVSSISTISGYIYVNVSNTWNCETSDSFYINAAPCCEIAMPDAFTPNGDGINDTYTPMNGEQFSILSFMIANRRGEIVFSDITPSAAWDGTYNGEESGTDTYNYYIKYVCKDETIKEKKGTIILLK